MANSIFKSAPIRSKAITNAAKGQACTLQIPDVCNGDPSTTVACHSPLAEDRQGTKAPDHAVAFGCEACHSILDRRSTFRGNHCSEENQRFYFHRGMVRTLARLIEIGVIAVKK